MEKSLKHIGFIMDGNRSWARDKWLPQFEWHRRWYANARKVMTLCREYGLEYCSFWALSDDNITQRSKEEVKYLFDLLTLGILDIAKDAHKQWIKIVCIWDRSLLTKKCQENMIKAEEMTAKNTLMTTIVALGYGWQEEIVRAIKSYIESGSDVPLTKKTFSSYIESSEFPPADLIVRTWGHKRHSGFLLYNSPYAEYYFSELNWPAFDEWELLKILDDYSLRERKFGK